MFYRFGKAFYFISILAFIFTLLYFYSAMPEKVGIRVDESGNVDRILEKGSFFYGMILVFILLNAVVIFPPKSLETKSNKKFHRIFPIGDPYRDYLLGWFYSFGGIVNWSLGLLTLYIHTLNNQEELDPGKYNIWFYVIPSLLIIWLIGLFILFIGKFKTVKQS